MVMALPELRLLQAATAVSKELNFSRAADRLHIGQSTLSEQVYDLENSREGVPWYLNDLETLMQGLATMSDRQIPDSRWRHRAQAADRE
jgi:hypothetical protein